jgi:hypothetical protein
MIICWRHDCKIRKSTIAISDQDPPCRLTTPQGRVDDGGDAPGAGDERPDGEVAGGNGGVVGGGGFGDDAGDAHPPVGVHAPVLRGPRGPNLLRVDLFDLVRCLTCEKTLGRYKHDPSPGLCSRHAPATLKGF